MFVKLGIIGRVGWQFLDRAILGLHDIFSPS